MKPERFYRRNRTASRLHAFTVVVKETDLWLAVREEFFRPELPGLVERRILKLRRVLEDYLKEHPFFASALEPCLANPNAPAIVVAMTRAGNLAGVGPMAAVAGAIAEAIGIYLLGYSPEVMVENGGDVFLKVLEPTRVGIYAGESVLSGRLAIRVSPAKTPLGICTSSGTLGHSFSRGRADAAVAVAPSTALADAAATALGNLVSGPGDLEAAIESARTIKGLTGALLISGDKMAAWGDIELVTE